MKSIDILLRQMIDQKASDLHMVVGRPPLFRSRGELVESDAPVLTPEMVRQVIGEILTPEQTKHVEANLDLDFAYELPDGAARFRANVLWQHRGMGAVLRIIPSQIMTVEQLGLPPVVKKVAELPRGLVLVTGPTGSGKSTTLAAMIDYINTTRDAHIITIEDPLEFVHPNKRCLITQREVKTHTKSFATGLKMAAREDPDIILVGEMRDLETIRLALAAAELGILVFGTLHTNSAAKTIDRVIDAFPADEQPQVRVMLADSLKAVIAQQLLKTADGKGRCAANEVLVATSALSNLIREGKTGMINSLIQTSGNLGMQSMDQALMKFIEAKKITPQAAYEKAIDKELFAKLAAAEGGEGAAEHV
ncbi:MAG: type IV pilus twitching motility protein PilT [Deltaproteobacteria bacterium]|nr:type IV pilus twitching motility protein PilT [Deltaproteobacteria bacterium]